MMEKEIKKIFVSIPMSGCLEESKVKWENAKEHLSKLYPNAEIHSGYDVYNPNEELQTDAYYMGKDIKTLLESDLIVSMPGWQKSKGCKVERFAAKVYGIKILDWDFIARDSIWYMKGDATDPCVRPEEYGIICHCCNCMGAWGKGFVVPLGQRYPQAKKAYFDFINSTPIDNRLGNAQIVRVAPNLMVANVMGQFDYRRNKSESTICIDYDALRNGLEQVAEHIMKGIDRNAFSIHMPRIGCGLAGGEWSKVEEIINDVFIKKGIRVTVYDL